jgi:hypothetical protein
LKGNRNFPRYIAPDFLQYLSEGPKREKAKTRKENKQYEKSKPTNS